MDEISETFPGKLSNLKDALDQLAERFGYPLLEPLAVFVQQ